MHVKGFAGLSGLCYEFVRAYGLGTCGWL